MCRLDVASGGSKKTVLGLVGGSNPGTGRGTSGGYTCLDLLRVDIFNLIRKGQQRCGLCLPAGLL